MSKETNYHEVTLDILRNHLTAKESIKSKRKGLFGNKLLHKINMDSEYDLLKKGRDRLAYFLDEFEQNPCFEEDMQDLWIAVADEFIRMTDQNMELINLLRYSYFSLSLKDKVMYEKQFDTVQEKVAKNLIDFSQEFFDKYELRYGS